MTSHFEQPSPVVMGATGSLLFFSSILCWRRGNSTKYNEVWFIALHPKWEPWVPMNVRSWESLMELFCFLAYFYYFPFLLLPLQSLTLASFFLLLLEKSFCLPKRSKDWKPLLQKQFKDFVTSNTSCMGGELWIPELTSSRTGWLTKQPLDPCVLPGVQMLPEIGGYVSIWDRYTPFFCHAGSLAYFMSATYLILTLSCPCNLEVKRAIYLTKK